MAFSAIVLGLCAALICIYLALLPRRQRHVSVQWLSSWKPVLPRGRRLSISKTPPRSLSPRKCFPDNLPPPVEHRNIFPPSQRDTLQAVARSYPEPTRTKLLATGPVELEFEKNMIPLTADYRNCAPSICTPTGFSIEEVKLLGDFPNYAELSGVPLPEPYGHFKIDTACARPYRPFRWAYHQTMCKVFSFTRICILLILLV